MNNKATKKNNRLNIWFGLFVLLPLISLTILACFMPQAVYGAEYEPCPKGKIRLNVRLGKMDPCVTDIWEYTKNFYDLFIGVIGIFAAVMIMYAGFQWITASGNSQRIERAKDNFVSAIVGVVIALISYVLLNLINPMVANLQKPQLDTIVGQTNLAVGELCVNMLGENWSQRVESPNASCGVQNRVIRDAQGNPITTSAVCWGHECASGKSCFKKGGTWSCQPPQKQCEDANANECKSVDAMLRDREHFGCIAHENKCIYGPIIPLRQGQGTVGVAPNEFERINCETSPENICWKVDGSGAAPTKCNDYPDRYNQLLYCTNEERAIQGAQSVCVHKIGSDPPEYYLWTGEAQGDDISRGLCATTL